MKKPALFLLSLVFILSAVSMPYTALASQQPQGYWPYFTAYENAVQGGNVDDILRTGDALLAFYSKFPINSDIAGMSYNIYYYRYTNAVFEKKGNYDAAIQNAQYLKAVSEYLGFNDMTVAAGARSEKLDPMTEVYALSNQKTPAIYTGAKYEPESGTYFGRVASAGTTSLRNASDIANEAVVSFYVEAGKNTAADFSWMIDPYDDGTHLVHIALNFPDKAATAAKIVAGEADNNLKTTLRYLAGLRCPVFLRIGGEMNLWEMDAALFTNAYLHVAELAHALAPNVALVWSPNYVGSWGSDVSQFYPGDAYVDWVGASLYCNSDAPDGQTPDGDYSMYFGLGAFADSILSIRDVDRFAQAHNKPVIVTEGGTGIVSNVTGHRYDSEASAQITQRYTSLNMVYPNVKAIVYFDVDYDGDQYKYELADSADVSKAYQAAVSANPTLLSKKDMSKPSYVKLAGYTAPSGTVDICAYGNTVYSGSMNVTYYLAGRKVASLDALPYRLTLDAQALAAGRYEFDAVFNDGAGFAKTKTYTLTKLDNGSVVFTEGYNAVADAPSGWAKNETDQAAAQGLIPDALRTVYTADITRLDFCRLVINLTEQKTGKSISQVLQDRGIKLNYGAFTDTTDKNVLEANALGIVSGRGNGMFDGSAGITREEAAKMLKNAADALKITKNSPAVAFSDASDFSPWAVSAIDFVSSTADKVSGKPVMGGISAGVFSPKGQYSYQQAFITMLRLNRAD